MSTHVKIVKTPDVLHGKPRFDGTRIGVYMIAEGIREGGWTVEETVAEYPDLSREQVDAALDYYDDHPEAMDVIRQGKEANRRLIQERSRAPTGDSEGEIEG
ncbi:DUF433 domain-containing protein [Halococcus salsus]|uniref:DUF433 domain-containing protein n=1 Tax=Halococcus salsus TaxID=2162894 RepID=UPI00135A34BE|nr:DUF433 domain-containing protein [Halococcus salsus]